MDSRAHFVPKTISRFTGTTVIFLGIYLILSDLQHVAGRSLLNSVESSATDDASEEETTTVSSSSTPPPLETVELDLYGRLEDEWDMMPNSSSRRYTRSKNSSDFQLAVHLQDCDLDNENEWIEIRAKGVRLDRWYCTNSAASILYDVLDGHEEFEIIPHFKTEFWNSEKVKAKLVINIYKDIDQKDSCGSEFFDCYQTLCPKRCCSDGGTSGGGGSDYEEEGRDIPLNFWTFGDTGKSRCIPNSLRCNARANCGTWNSIDEADEICVPNYCSCQSICLTWNYIITSLAIAVLFIITPTVIVFALFHRRNVSIERERLIRLAQARMAELRAEFISESPSNDLPPSYDEVYDIKSPPPCFCQAIAIEMGLNESQLEEVMQGITCDQHCPRNKGQDQLTEIEMTERIRIEDGNIDSQTNPVGTAGTEILRESNNLENI